MLSLYIYMCTLYAYEGIIIYDTWFIRKNNFTLTGNFSISWCLQEENAVKGEDKDRMVCVCVLVCVWGGALCADLSSLFSVALGNYCYRYYSTRGLYQGLCSLLRIKIINIYKRQADVLCFEMLHHLKSIQN